MILSQKVVTNFIPGTETQTWLQLSHQKVGSRLLMAIYKQNNRHATPPQTHIAFSMPGFKGIGSRHKSGIVNNQSTQWKTPHDNRCFNRNKSHSKSNKLLLTVISISLSLNNSVINPPQMSSFCQQSSRSSHFTPRDNRCFNSKDRTPRAKSFHHCWYMWLLHWMIQSITQLSCPLFVNSHPYLHITQWISCKIFSIPSLTSPDPSNTMTPTSTNKAAIFIDAWLMCLSWHQHNGNSML